MRQKPAAVEKGRGKDTMVVSRGRERKRTGKMRRGGRGGGEAAAATKTCSNGIQVDQNET